MKLDVEGMEPSVLRGANRVLDRWRPVVFAEAHTVEEKDEIAAILRPYGYTEDRQSLQLHPDLRVRGPTTGR